ncbi:MAG: RNA 2',3'-cyclic phosphodiesterase [Betaproteobacteria bacterium]
MSTLANAHTSRVFFALWPERAIHARLAHHAQSLHSRLGGQITEETSIHLTLVFVGNIMQAALESLCMGAAAVEFAPFTVSIERAGCWSHNQIAWLAPSTVPMPLLSLVSQLQTIVRAAGIELDRHDYAPHLTVVRKAKCARFDPTVEAIAWPVEDFVLVRSQRGQRGSRYEVIGRWPGTTR